MKALVVWLMFLAAGPAWATITASPGDVIKPGTRTTISYDATGTLVLENRCATISGSHYPGTGGSIELYALQSGSIAVTSGDLLFVWDVASGVATALRTSHPSIGLNVLTAPSGGTVGKLFLWCSEEVGAPDGGGTGGGAFVTCDPLAIVVPSFPMIAARATGRRWYF